VINYGFFTFIFQYKQKLITSSARLQM